MGDVVRQIKRGVRWAMMAEVEEGLEIVGEEKEGVRCAILTHFYSF